MFIVWGTKTLKRLIGVTHDIDVCSNCRNENYMEYRSYWKWFTIFWIPLFPISTKKYYEVCPICSYGHSIEKPEINI